MRAFHGEGKAAAAVYADDDRNGRTRLQALRLSVKRLTEFHDVHTVLTQRRANRRTGISLTGRYLQLDIGGYFLSHKKCYSIGVSASGRMWIKLTSTAPLSALIEPFKRANARHD